MVFGAADVWKGALGAHAAQEAVAQVLAPMLRACPGLFEKLAVIAAAGRGSLVSPMTNGAVRSVPLAETLCTNLIVRYISAQGKHMRTWYRERGEFPLKSPHNCLYLI